MKTLKRWWNLRNRLHLLFPCVAVLSGLLVSTSHAYPLGRVTFFTDAPFLGMDSGGGQQGASSLTATGTESLVTISAWADADATVPASLSQWFWLLGVDSWDGNYALIDGAESMTVEVDKSVGVSMFYFLYTGGTGGTTNNLARISVSGFKSDPAAIAVTSGFPRISNFDYTNGTLSFDYLYDSGSDFGLVMLENPMASAGQILKITGAVSPNGDATNWGAALYRVDVQEAYAGPQVSPASIPTANTYTTPDGWMTIRGYADTNATVLANLGTYLDECVGVQGGSSDGLIETNESITLQFADTVGLSRLDLVYSKGGYDVMISGFLSDPGLIDVSAGALASSYSAGTLSLTLRRLYFPFLFHQSGCIGRANTANQCGQHAKQPFRNCRDWLCEHPYFFGR